MYEQPYEAPPAQFQQRGAHPPATQPAPGAPGWQPQTPPPGKGNSTAQTDRSDIIAKAAAKNKFLDFRPNLVLAHEKDYAMIHGIGGSQHALRSTIKCLITDYGVKPSVVVSANISPELPSYILEVCRKNVGLLGAVPATTNKRASMISPLQAMAAAPQLGQHLLVAAGLSNQPCVAVATTFLQNLESEEEVPEVKALLDLARKIPALPDDGSGNIFVPLPVSMINQIADSFSAGAAADSSATKGKGGDDFQYRQERVNSYRKENNLCPVSILTISRVGIRKTGEVSKLPWTVKIENFKAPSVERGGMTSYNGRGIVDKREAFVALTDFDMYRCLYRVERFIELWEMAYGIPLLTKGLAAKEAAFQAAKQAFYGAQPY